MSMSFLVYFIIFLVASLLYKRLHKGFPKLMGVGIMLMGAIMFCLGGYLFYFVTDWQSAGFASKNAKSVMEGWHYTVGAIFILVGGMHAGNSQAIADLEKRVRKIEANKLD